MRRYTLRDFNSQFPDDAACLEFLFRARWPEGVSCVTCGRVTPHHRRSDRPQYACQDCGRDIAPMARTIFHKSETSLRLWYYAIYLMAQTRCGISAKQLERELGVTYKTAWRMFRQIRTLMGEDIRNLGNEVEADETYVGGRGNIAKGKTIVFGAVERGGRAATNIAPNVQTKTLMPMVWRRIPAYEGHTVYTDEASAYDLLPSLGYRHLRVNHSRDEWARGTAHTNTIEGFWSLVKRGIGGVYHAVSPKYLQTYLDEYTFRYNRRRQATPMFVSLLERLPLVLRQV